jgi:hypothetical protein
MKLWNYQPFPSPIIEVNSSNDFLKSVSPEGQYIPVEHFILYFP